MRTPSKRHVRRTLLVTLLIASSTASTSAQQADCQVHVAPFFRGTGGFVAKPSDGRSVRITVERGSSSRAETLFARSDGLVVQLLNSSTTASLCSDDSAAPVECRISFSGIEDGGWYWVNGDRNAAVAPLICEDELGGAEALDPGGVAVTRSQDGTATLFVHDAQKLMGIIPHLAPPAGANSCQERVAPIFRGGGGYVLEPASGASPVVTFEEGGRTESRNLDVRPDDGLAVGLLSSPLCPGAADRPVACRVSFSGVEDGGWYWVNGDRNAAVAPLICAEQLGGASALDPGGVAVTASTRGTGTLVVHETQNLMAIVPHLARVPPVADLVVESPAVSESSLGPDQRFTLSAEVFNRRGGGSAATTVRWYRSSDSEIDDSDIEVGISSLAALDASDRANATTDLEAPSDTGTYWYGACVEAVADESDTDNNCSSGATLEVSVPGDFDLVSATSEPEGIAYADGRFYVVEETDDKVYVYDGGGNHMASADFDLDSQNGSPSGITYADDRFYVVDSSDSKVYAHNSDGCRMASADFALDSQNDAPTGITYAGGRFYVLDYDDEKVYAYDSDGSRTP